MFFLTWVLEGFHTDFVYFIAYESWTAPVTY